MIDTPPADIIAFWTNAGWDRWYAKNDAFDAEIKARFLPTYEAARDGKLSLWEDSDDGTLALILALDQFPRNLGVDARVDAEMRQFVYMPLMHSENLADQEQCCALFRATGESDNLKFADIHAEIIRKFGRFPHRNAVLGRATTAEEQAFLDAGGFKG